MKYAQINTDKICIAVSQLCGEVISEFMIPIGEYENPLNKQYENNMWVDIPEISIQNILTEEKRLDSLETIIEDAIMRGML